MTETTNMSEQHAQTHTDSNAQTLPVPPADLNGALRQLGLEPVRAWVPDPNATASATAKRARRAREKAAGEGMKQISITLPLELHPLAKELAARTKAGEPIGAVLEALKALVCEVAESRGIEAGGATSGDAPVALGFWRSLRIRLWRWLTRSGAQRARLSEVVRGS